MPQDTSGHRGRPKSFARDNRVCLHLIQVVIEEPVISGTKRGLPVRCVLESQVTIKPIADGAKHLGIRVNIFYCYG